MTLQTDTRGVSAPLHHALTLGITTIIVTTLIASAGGFLEEERRHTTGDTLSTIGASLARDLAAVDRLVGPKEEANARLAVSLPVRVVGGTYTVSLRSAGGCNPPTPVVACLHLRAPRTGVERTIPVRLETGVENGTVTGGDVVISARNGTLSIRNEPA